MVYIAGEEMTRYTMALILEKWIAPNIDTSAWEYFDLSCRVRDETNDQVLHDAVAAGKEHCAIFKEPTITPTAVQREEMGLKTALNEVYAYDQLALTGDALSDRSRLIMTYAVCGFANFSSVGILTGGLVAIAPSRREDILQLAPRALISGTLATLMTGAAVGALPQGLFG